jgi:NADH:ubiquinone oxidoreductase subunit F (NADH-binding)/NADH:ubiquinone oxidoreductase subunit E/NAD-dependent dihydropyrimidine dehydrogenase PreA subunit
MTTEARLAEMRQAHRVLARIDFEVAPLEKGYANRTLRVDLDRNAITIHPVTEQMKELWTGGKGFDLWLMMHEISRETRWNSPENPICISPGPLCGTASFPGAGKSLLTTVSPLTDIILDTNVGGHFGPYLKFAGFDALVIVGKAAEETMLVIDAARGTISIETCPLESIDSHLLTEELTRIYAESELDRCNIALVTTGRAADHIRMGMLNFSFWDWRRNVARLKQAGRGGIGRVFRDKKLKALVARNRATLPPWRVAENKVAALTTPKKISVCGQSEVDEITAIIQRWHRDPEYVIEMMQDVQERFRHIPKTALEEICKQTGAPKAQLYHIATFYKAFSLEPRGETICQVCMGTACHVKGASRILDSFERVLEVQAGETTRDGKYTLEAVACLGACSIAPVVKIGEEVYGNVEARNVEKLLARQKKAAAAAKAAPSAAAEPLASPRAPEPLEQIAARERERLARYRGLLMVCTGTGCVSAKGFDLRDRLAATLKARGLERDYLVVPTGCNGFCAAGPIVVLQPDGIFYQGVKPADADAIVDEHLRGGKVVERLLHKDPVSGETHAELARIPFFEKQQLIALRNKGLIDPEEIDQYIARDGYMALRKALTELKPEEVIREVKLSGLRGRGGGGFPAGVKWESGRKAALARSVPIHVVCNGDEGDPGAFMDRSIIETDPHAVIEGMAIGAYAVGSHEGYIYIRKEYPLAQHRLRIAIDQARERGLLGQDILGTGFAFDLQIHRGAGAFVCGESTALMASMQGKPGEPRAKYIHNVEYGFRDQPTVLNNVETWANVPAILEKGGKWFASIGTGDVSENPWNGSAGTKVFSLVGKIRNTGLVEVPMGITLRRIIEEVGGGIPGGRKFKAVQTGGPSGGCLPASLLEMPVDFDSLTSAGSMMGSGGMIVMDDRTCMVDVARYFVSFLVDESCGKCTPCREGLFAMNNILTRICQGEGRPGDIELLEEISATVQDASLCQLGGSAPNPVLSTIKYFREEYREHIEHKRCPAGACKALVRYRILPDKCTGCLACIKPCPQGAITGEREQVHLLDQDKCIKCGICFEVCRYDAVEVA